MCECALERAACGGRLAVRPPLGLDNIGIDEVFVGDVQFEDTVPAVQVGLGAGRVVGVGVDLVLQAHKRGWKAISVRTFHESWLQQGAAAASGSHLVIAVVRPGPLLLLVLVLSLLLVIVLLLLLLLRQQVVQPGQVVLREDHVQHLSDHHQPQDLQGRHTPGSQAEEDPSDFIALHIYQS